METAGYKVIADHEETHWWFRSRRDLIVQQLEKVRTDRGRSLEILDYGCGTGFNFEMLSQFGNVLGADLFPQKISEFQKTSRFEILDLNQDVTSQYGRFDLVTALDVLEHIDDDVAGLKDIARFLGPGGEVLLLVPAYMWLWSGEDQISLHKRRYTAAKLEKCIHGAAGKILFLSYFNSSILPLMAAAVLGRRLFQGATSEKSNVRRMPGVLNSLLYRLTSFENTQVGREKISVPFGPSLIARVQF